MRILIFKMEGIAYNSTRIFADMLAAGFEKCGANVEVFDIIEHGDIQELEKLQGREYDAIIDFNSKLPDLITDDDNGNEMYFLDSIKGKFYNYIVDHPVYHHKFLSHKLKDYNVICVDMNHAEYVKKFYPHIKSVITEPLGAIAASDCRCEDKRENAILFLGTYLCPQSYYEIIDSMPKELGSGVKAVIDIMQKCPKLTYEAAVEKYITDNDTQNVMLYNKGNGKDDVSANRGIINDKNHTDKQLSEIEADKLAVYNTMFFMADIYMRAKIRQEVLETFARTGVRLVICGEKYDESPITEYENVKIISQVSYEQGLILMHNYRYVLNIMPLFKAGIHDRVVNAMINGAVAISDTSSLMDKYFEKNKDYLCYDVLNKNTINRLVKDINENETDWKMIADNGNRKASCMTFDKVAADIIEAL